MWAFQKFSKGSTSWYLERVNRDVGTIFMGMDSNISTLTRHGMWDFVNYEDSVLEKSPRARHVGFRNFLKGSKAWNLERVGEACELSKISERQHFTSREHGTWAFENFDNGVQETHGI
jgi:hypothetical protein